MIKLTFLQSPKADQDEIISILDTHIFDGMDSLYLKFEEGDIIDTVFHPTYKTAKVYTVPKGMVLFHAVNNFKIHPKIQKILTNAGIECDPVTIKFP